MSELFPEILSKNDIGDWIFPSSNYYGVPDLLPSCQPRGLELPVNRWGAKARNFRVEGQTIHFYTDDYRFTGLWKDPSSIMNSGCRAMVEPNFSTNGEMPKAVALSYVYMKRWLARLAQSWGIEVWVDLAMEKCHHDIALIGVPKGWKAYATYTYTTGYDLEEWLFPQYELACQHAGTDEILFWVYGGEEKVQELCQDRGWLWTPAHQQAYFRNIGSGKVRKAKEPKVPRQRGIKSLEKQIKIEEVGKTMTLEAWI